MSIFGLLSNPYPFTYTTQVSVQTLFSYHFCLRVLKNSITSLLLCPSPKVCCLTYHSIFTTLRKDHRLNYVTPNRETRKEMISLNPIISNLQRFRMKCYSSFFPYENGCLPVSSRYFWTTCVRNKSCVQEQKGSTLRVK